MPIYYETIQDMISDSESTVSLFGIELGTHKIANEVSPSWDVNSTASEAAAKFYEQWSVYLSPTNMMIATVIKLPEMLSKGLYYLSYSLETIYKNLFKLFGLLDSLSDTETFIGKMYFYLQITGAAIFGLLLIIRVVMSFIGKRVRYQDVISNLLLVTAVTSVLPLAIKEGVKAIVPAAYGTLSAPDASGTTTSLSIRPFQDNVTDLNVIIENAWNTTTLGMDEQTGFLNPAAAKDSKGNKINFNSITDETLSYTRLNDYYGGVEEEELEQFIDLSKDDSSSTYYGVAPILSSKLAEHSKNYTRIEGTKPSWITGAVGAAFADVYMRYKVNWLGLFIQQIIIIAILLSLAVNFGKSLFNIIVNCVIAPIVGYSSVEDSSKFKELLTTIVGGFAGIVFEVMMLRIGVEVMANYDTVNLTGITGIDTSNFTSGLTYWQNVGAAIIVYTSIFFAISSGSNSIERWLGVSTRQNGGRQLAGAVGTAAVAGYFGTKAAGNVLKAPFSASKSINRGIGHVKGAMDATKANGGGLKGAAKTFGNMLTEKGKEARRTTGRKGRGLDPKGNEFNFNPEGGKNTPEGKPLITPPGNDGSSSSKGSMNQQEATPPVGKKDEKPPTNNGTTGPSNVPSASKDEKVNNLGGLPKKGEMNLDDL